MALTVLDLFCGCGGMSWGLSQEGFTTIAGIDNWDPALRTFEANHSGAQTISADIDQFEPSEAMERLGLREGELACLVGGPPCQGFSKNVRASYRFLEDERNQLFRDFMRFVETFKPETVVMENVAEIYNAYGGQVREEVVGLLEKMGYSTEVCVLYAPNFGVPQRRRRCIFLSSRTGIRPRFPEESFAAEESESLFGKKLKYHSAWSAISDLPVLKNGEGHEPMPYGAPPENDYQESMRRGSTELHDHVTRCLNETQYARISSIGPGQGLKDLPPELRTKGGYSGAYGRLDFEMMAPTITRWFFHPGSGRFSHPREPRLLTIREGARLQSFSDDFRFHGTYIQKSHQLGNAVPPLLMRHLASSIKACCSSGH